MKPRRGEAAERPRRRPLRPSATPRVAGARADDGTTAIEYALIGSLIAIAIYTGASLIGISLAGVFTPLANWL